MVQVVATAPADVVQSPVSAGICAAGTVPLARLEAFKLVSAAPLIAGRAVKAVGVAELPVPFPRRVFAAIAGNCASVADPPRFENSTWPQAGTPVVEMPLM